MGADARSGAPGVHVCFCSDDPDLRPLAAAINSTIAGARDPARVVFHVITAPAKAPIVASALSALLPLRGATLRVHHEAALQARIQSLVAFRRSSGARKGLASPFNFAPFYLDRFLAAAGRGLPRKLLYLDTDVVLRGDVAELLAVDLRGHAAAAVEDCSQQFDMYIDFKQLSKLGFQRPGLDAKACVFNRGVFVVDLVRWRELRITEDIELWMARYRTTKKDLYHFGMSQPPWLLALNGHYQRLGVEWNCRGLGREFLKESELQELKKARGLDKAALAALGLRHADSTSSRPYISHCAASAKLLHFNGALKPWRSAALRGKQQPPLCAAAAAAAKPPPRLRDGYVRCAELWWAFLAPGPAAQLAAGAAGGAAGRGGGGGRAAGAVAGGAAGRAP